MLQTYYLIYTLEVNNKALCLYLKNGAYLTRERFLNLVAQTVREAGWQGNFTSHSFSVGAASTAAALGTPDYMIRAMGR